MLGLINQAFEAFIRSKYGDGMWDEIVLRCPSVETNWVSSCPYDDKALYE